MRTTKPLLLTTAMVVANVVNAQLGLAGSEHNGLWDLERQPASISLSGDVFQFNLVKLGVGIDNNYVRLDAGQFGFGDLDRLPRVNEEVSDPLRTNVAGRALDVDTRIMGPSMMLSFGRSAIAFTTALRARASVSDLEGLLRMVDDDGLNIDLQENTRLNVLRFSTRQLAWGEAGLTFAHELHLSKRLRVHAGATGKYLMGVYGGFVRNGAPLLTVNGEVQQLSDVDLSYGMSDVEALEGGHFVQGSGLGGDVGVVVEWLRSRKCGTEEAKHLLRLGLAVTDLGAIDFKGKAHTNTISNGSSTLEGFGDLAVEDLASLDTALSHVLLGDAHASEQRSGLRMGLPTALRANIDVNVIGKLYVNAAGTFGMDRGLNSVEEPDMLSVAARFGGRTFEIGLPVSLYRMEKLRVGLTMRAGGFMIGSDKLGGMLGLTDIGGMDVYMGVRIAIKGGI